jgi:hypothetical protein
LFHGFEKLELLQFFFLFVELLQLLVQIREVASAKQENTEQVFIYVPLPVSYQNVTQVLSFSPSLRSIFPNAQLFPDLPMLQT